MEKNKEPIKVVIDGNEYNFENYSFKWEDKPYIKEPIRNNGEFSCFVEPCKYISVEDFEKVLVKLGHNVEYGKEIFGSLACPFCGRVYGEKENEQ